MPQWITVDFERNVTIDGASAWYYADRQPINYTWQISYDNQTWTNLTSVTNNSDYATYDHFNAAEGQYMSLGL